MTQIQTFVLADTSILNKALRFNQPSHSNGSY